MTCDGWYTLFGLPRTARAAYGRRHRGIWRQALLEAGLAGAATDRWVDAMYDHLRTLEFAGRTPPIGEQAVWLATTTGVPIRTARVRRELDRLLIDSPVRAATGVHEALEQLKARGLRLGIVSNVVFEAETGVRGVLRRLDLDRYFDARTFSSGRPWGKPRPELFWTCLAQMHRPPSSAVHIGDGPYDVLGAFRAGLTPVQYSGMDPPRSSYRLSSRFAFDLPPHQHATSWKQFVHLVDAQRERIPSSPSAPRSS
ncbi:MAG: HAD family hydrolase [Thermoplasmata archaeon]|nr:HAD family hydrolase [Thermoplasmata archaeon]